MNRNLLRYRDVIMALDVAKDYNVFLGKLQLQKYIYLSDTLALIWQLLGARQGHETFRHGPYDQAIQNAVDALAFRGFINIVESEYQQDGSIRAKYEISSFGQKLVNDLCEEPIFKQRLSVFEEIGRNINSRGWSKLKLYVYSEPTFVNERALGWGKNLQVNSALTNLSLQIIWHFQKLANNIGHELSREKVTYLYFEVLDEFSILQPSFARKDGDS